MIFDVFLFNMRLVIQHSDVFDIYFFDTTLLASHLLTCASVTMIYAYTRYTHMHIHSKVHIYLYTDICT